MDVWMLGDDNSRWEGRGRVVDEEEEWALQAFWGRAREKEEGKQSIAQSGAGTLNLLWLDL